jgi:hypothetical protein
MRPVGRSVFLQLISRITVKAAQLFCVLMALLLAAPAFAKVDIRQTKRLYMPAEYVDEDLAHLSQAILPKAIDPNDSSRSVVGKIVDNSLTYWYNNSEFKNTSVGRAATQVEKKMRADVNLGTDTNKIQHRLSFRVLAAQALAKLEYVGWFKASLNYDAKSAKTEAEVFENLPNNKDLVVSHSVTGLENKSQLSLRWNW